MLVVTDTLVLAVGKGLAETLGLSDTVGVTLRDVDGVADIEDVTESDLDKDPVDVAEEDRDEDAETLMLSLSVVEGDHEALLVFVNDAVTVDVGDGETLRVRENEIDNDSDFDTH